MQPDRKRATMRDVAALADVSLKTVSRVVNGEPGVSPTLEGRVQAAISELDFRPDAGASSLRRAGGRTNTVGVLLEDVANPYSSAVLRAIEDSARGQGFMVFSASLDGDGDRERNLVRAFGARRTDGLIIASGTTDQSYLVGEIQAGTPIVCIDRQPQGIDVDAVLTTDGDGSYSGVRHLIDQGHRKIAFLSDRLSIPTAQLRFEGYHRALTEAGIEVSERSVISNIRDDIAAQEFTERLLESHDPPTALFTAQNLITIGAIRALRKLGLADRVALVGFDDFPLAELMSPGVTVVAQNPAIIGATAASLLFERIKGTANETRHHLIPTTLIRRGSGEIAPSHS